MNCLLKWFEAFCGAERTDSVLNQNWFIRILTWDQRLIGQRSLQHDRPITEPLCHICVCFTSLRAPAKEERCLMFAVLFISVSSLQDVLLMSGTCLSENVKMMCIIVIKVIIMMLLRRTVSLPFLSGKERPEHKMFSESFSNGECCKKNALQNYKRCCWRSVGDCVLSLHWLERVCMTFPVGISKTCVALNQFRLNVNNRLKMPQQISRSKSANRDPCACLQGFVQLTAFSPHELDGQSTSISLHPKRSPANDHLRKPFQTCVTQTRRSCCFCCLHWDNSAVNLQKGSFYKSLM